MSKLKKRKPETRDPKKRAISAACHWLNKCYDLGVTAGEIVAQSVVNRNAVNRKENEKGKETFPPAPPIEKREVQEKGAGVGGARTREGRREERIRQVSEYNAKIGGNIDPEYFVDYYADEWPREWEARLRNWIKENKRSGRLPIAPEPTAPTSGNIPDSLKDLIHA